MDDIDNLTAFLEKISIDSDIETEYMAAFGRILRFVKKYRIDTITEHELEVTEALARPFTQGGLLILLLEPGCWHPWTQGIHNVIQNCRSLRVMDDGLKFVSEEVLSLTNDVSLLDLRPFLVKGDYTHLESKVWERLYDLVYEAIKAKKPDVLLCMGNVCERALHRNKNVSVADKNQEVIAAFNPRNCSLNAYSLRDTQIIQAHHPGHFVNYHPSNPQKRQDLLNSIYKAYDALISKHSRIQQKIGIVHSAASCKLTSSNLNAMPAPFTNMEWSQNCLDILMTLSFQPNHRLPSISIEPGPFYCLEASHSRWFERCTQAELGSIDQARALIFPVFLELNRCFRKTSWFDSTYKIDWRVLSRILKEFTPELEQACYLSASGNETGHITGSGERPKVDGDSVDVRISRTVLRARHLWESRPHHPKRTAEYVGPFIENL